jgi:hypothetical protein
VIRGIDGQQRGQTGQAVVVVPGRRVLRGGLQGAGLLARVGDQGLALVAGRDQPLACLLDVCEPQARQQRVVQLRGRLGDQRPEFAVRQEGPIVGRGATPPRAGNAGRLPGGLDDRLLAIAIVEILGAVPLALEHDRSCLLDVELQRDPWGVRLVEVAPAVAPALLHARHTQAAPREDHLDGFGKAALA